METDEMRDGKSDRASGIKAQSGDRWEERSGDRQEGTIGRSKDRMVIEMAIGSDQMVIGSNGEIGVVCHSVGLRAACSDEGFTRKMGLHAACSDEGFMEWVIMQPARMRASWKMRPQNIRFWAVFIAVIGGKSSSSTPLNSVMNSVIQ
jgi:hypothetical protein